MTGMVPFANCANYLFPGVIPSPFFVVHWASLDFLVMAALCQCSRAVCNCGSVVGSLCGRQFLHDRTSVGVRCDCLNLFQHVILADAYRALAFFDVSPSLQCVACMRESAEEFTHRSRVYIPFSFARCDVLAACNGGLLFVLLIIAQASIRRGNINFLLRATIFLVASAIMAFGKKFVQMGQFPLEFHMHQHQSHHRTVPLRNFFEQQNTEFVAREKKVKSLQKGSVNG